MRILSYQNANVTVDATGGDILGGTTQQLVANVEMQLTTRPGELDLPSGAFWIWPLRRASLTISGTLPPGVPPKAVPTTFAADQITIEAVDTAGAAITVPIKDAFLSGIRIATEQVSGDRAMPALTQQLMYVFFIDDDGTTGDY